MQKVGSAWDGLATCLGRSGAALLQGSLLAFVLSDAARVSYVIGHLAFLPLA